MITIDGSTGEVFEGVAGGVEAVVPEATVLLGWARELGIAIPGEEAAGDAPPAAAAHAFRAPPATRRRAARRCSSRATAQPDALAVALGCPAEDGDRARSTRLVADGLAEPGAGSFRLTAAGKAAAATLLAADRGGVGHGRAPPVPSTRSSRSTTG